MTELEAKQVVKACEAVPSLEWESLRRLEPRNFVRYMRHWLVAMTVIDFPSFLWYGPYWGARKYYRGLLFQEMAEWHQHWEKKLKFLLVAREHTKTQMAIAHMAWRLVGDVNRRILIRAYNTPKANQIGKGLAEILDDKRFKDMYTWVRPKQREGTNQRFMWGNEGFMLARPDVGVRVPSVEMCGIEKDPTGGHFTDQKCDDFAVGENEVSEVLQQQLYDKFQADDNLILPGGQREILGTIWAVDGFLDSAAKRQGIFRDMDYDLFYRPAEEPAFDNPVYSQEVVMQPDRKTFVMKEAVGELPTQGQGARWCQARITFDVPSHLDTVVVVREVVANTQNAFMVNRPIESVYLGQPRGCTVGNMRPAAPMRFTMDSEDLLAPPELREVMPDRGSLYLKRRSQGPHVYGGQMLLNPRHKDACLFDEDKVQEVRLDEFNAIVHKYRTGVWYVKCDLSTAKKTKSYTAFTTGFVCETGAYCRRFFWGLPRTHEIVLEMYRIVLWLEETYNAIPRSFQFEPANIENGVLEQIDISRSNPYEYFYAMDGKYRAFAEERLGQGRMVHVPIITVPRGTSAKMDRIKAKLDPILEQEKFFIVEGIEFEDRARKELREAVLTEEQGMDLLETMSDLAGEFKLAQVVREKKEKIVDIYEYYNKDAIRRGKLARMRSSCGGWP